MNLQKLSPKFIEYGETIRDSETERAYSVPTKSSAAKIRTIA